MNTPDAILVYGPPGGRLDLADYPWAETALLIAAGGASSTGIPGTTRVQAFPVKYLPPVLRIVCGAGGRDAAGRKGKDGYVIIELYREA